MFRRLITWKNVLLSLLAIVVVIYGVAFALSKGDYQATNQFIGHVLLADLNQGESIQGRLAAYDKALGAYYHNPVLGIGIGNYGPWAKGYPTVRPVTGWDIVNNEYIELLAETGLVGTIAFGLIIVVIFARALIAFKYALDPELRALLIGLSAALVGVLIQYNFMSTLYIIHVWVLIGLLVGVQNLILKLKAKSAKFKTTV